MRLLRLLQVQTGACALVGLCLLLHWMGIPVPASARALDSATQASPGSAPAVTTSVFLPLVAGPLFSARTPNPLDLTMTLDDAQATTVTVPLAGGSLTLNAGGSQYRLAFPRDSLLYTTTIVMRPISTVVGLSNTIQFIAGVHLEPEDVRLNQLAVLTITPGVSVPITQQMAFASHGLGQSAYLYPLVTTTTQLVFNLMHLSEYAVAQSVGQSSGNAVARPSDGPVPLQFSSSIPQLPEEQYLQQAAQLANAERAAVLSGGPPIPNYYEELVTLNQGYYQNVLLPKLTQAAQDCKQASGLLMPVLGWARQVTFWFGDSPDNPFNSQLQNVYATLFNVLANCWNQIHCIHRGLPSEVRYIYSLVRTIQMLGGDPLIYDPDVLIECPCDQIVSKPNWSAAVSWNYARRYIDNIEEVQMRLSGSVGSQLNPPTHAYPLTGSASYYSWTMYLPPVGNPIIFQGGPLYPYDPVQNIGARMSIFLHAVTCTYQFAVDAQVTTTNNINSALSRASAGLILSDEKPMSNFDSVLTGSGEFTGQNGYYAYLHKGDFFVVGTGGTAQVDWTFTPGP